MQWHVHRGYKWHATQLQKALFSASHAGKKLKTAHANYQQENPNYKTTNFIVQLPRNMHDTQLPKSTSQC